MNTLEAETQIREPVKATEVVPIIDCGRASERTRGTFFLIMFELGIPPADKLFPS